MSIAFCIASGPSLTQADVDFCRDKGKVYVVNDCYKLAPWADVLYACDLDWWDHHNGVPDFAGKKYTVTAEAAKKYDLTFQPFSTFETFSMKDNEISLGGNSGFQAMNLAAIHGADKIFLLGYDMGFNVAEKRHWFGDHPHQLNRDSNYKKWIESFKKAKPFIDEAGISVVNCSRKTALNCFPNIFLEDVEKIYCL